MSVQRAIDFHQVENAIQKWFAESTELLTIWADQDAQQPPYPYAVLNVISGPVKIGGTDEHRYTWFSPDPGVPYTPGQVDVTGPREITVSCQINVGKPNAYNPNMNSRSLMAVAQSALNLPSILGNFRINGMSVIDRGAINNFDVAVGSEWVSRTQMDVRFGLVASLVENAFLLENAEVSSNLDGLRDPDNDASKYNLADKTFGVDGGS